MEQEQQRGQESVSQQPEQEHTDENLQIKALFWRLKKNVKTKPGNLIKVFLPSFMLLLFTFILLQSDMLQSQIKLESTEKIWVTTSQPDNATNYFVDETDSRLYYSLTLRNCSLQNATDIGIVKTAEDSLQANQTIDRMFDLINETYAANNANLGKYALGKRQFDSIEAMNDNVREFDYYLRPMCFGLSWNEFAKPSYTINMHWNFRWKPSTNFPTGEFEEAPYNQLFLGKYVQTGFLQTMSIATASILEQEYAKTDHRFELAYMPMNSEQFNDNAWYEVITSLLPVTISMLSVIGIRLQQVYREDNEEELLDELKRLSLRNHSRFQFDFLLFFVPSVIIIPTICFVLVYFKAQPGISLGFMTVTVFLFAFNKFLRMQFFTYLMSPKMAHILTEAEEFLGLLVQVTSLYQYQVYPIWVYSTTAIFPYMSLSWISHFALVAFDFNSKIKLGENNIVTNGNDVNIILMISLGTFVSNFLALLYFWPLKIDYDQRDPAPKTWIFRPSHWYRTPLRRLCCIKKKSFVENGNNNTSTERGFPNEESLLNESAEAAADTELLTTQDEFASEIKFSCDKVTLDALTEYEREQIEIGNIDIDSVPKVKNLENRSLKISNLSKSFKKGEKVIDDLNITAFMSTILVIIGSTGCGKSTLINLLAKNIKADSGSAIYQGIDILKDTHVRDNLLAVCTQQHNLLEMLSVYENMFFFSRFYTKIPKEVIKKRIRENMLKFNLVEISWMKVQHLSKMQKKCLKMAILFIGDPKIVLIDEPTLGLDTDSKREVMTMLRKFTPGRIIILTSNDVNGVADVACFTAFMKEGKIFSRGKLDFFKNKYPAGYQIKFKLQKPYEEAHYDIENWLNFWLKQQGSNAEFKTNGIHKYMRICFMQKDLEMLAGELFEDFEKNSDKLSISQIDITTASLENIAEMALNEENSNVDKHDNQQAEMIESAFNQTNQNSNQTQQHPQSTFEELKRIEYWGPWGQFFIGVYAYLICTFNTVFLSRRTIKTYGLFFLILLQETFTLYFLELQHQRKLNYSNVESIYEEEIKEGSLPTLYNPTFADGNSTVIVESLLETALNVNGEENVSMVPLNCQFQSGMTVFEELTEYGNCIEEMTENSRNPHEEELNYAAYYIYQLVDNRVQNKKEWQNLEILEQKEDSDQIYKDGKNDQNSSPNRTKSLPSHIANKFQNPPQQKSITSSSTEQQQQMQTEYDYLISLAIYAKQNSFASAPTFGAAALNGIARDISGDSNLTINFNDYPWPMSSTMLPRIYPSVAEKFGVAALACAIYVQIGAVQTHGNPVASGWYNYFRTRGGSNISFILAHYLVSSLYNLMFVGVLILSINTLGYVETYFARLGIQWAFTDPLFVQFISFNFTNLQKRSANGAVLAITGTGVLIGMLAYVFPGAVMYSLGDSYMAITLAKTQAWLPLSAFIVGIQIVFCYPQLQLLQHQEDMHMELSEIQQTWLQQLQTYLYWQALIYFLLLLVCSSERVSRVVFCRKQPRMPEDLIRKLVHLEYVQDEDVRRERMRVQSVIEKRQANFDIDDKRYRKVCQPVEESDLEVLLVNNAVSWYHLRMVDLAGDSKGLQRMITESQAKLLRKKLIQEGILACKGVSFGVKRGEILVIFGENGAGVSSLLKCITGQNQIYSGDIILNGLHQCVYQGKPQKLINKVGYLNQGNTINSNLNVYQHMNLYSNLVGVPFSKRKHLIKEYLNRIGLLKYKNVKAVDLSAGNQRKLCILGAIIGNPSVIVLDEPLEGISSVEITEILSFIRTECSTSALVIGTKNPIVANYFADKVAFMNEGKFIGFGQFSDIVKKSNANIILKINYDFEEVSKVLLPQNSLQEQALDETECIAILQEWQDTLDVKAEDPAFEFFNPFDFKEEFSETGIFSMAYVMVKDSGGIQVSLLYNLMISVVLSANILPEMHKHGQAKLSFYGPAFAAFQINSNEVSYSWIYSFLRENSKKYFMKDFVVQDNNVYQMLQMLKQNQKMRQGNSIFAKEDQIREIRRMTTRRQTTRFTSKALNIPTQKDTSNQPELINTDSQHYSINL